MPFPRVNGAGYAVNDILPSADITQLDVNISKAGNVTDGDTWTPTAPIIVNSGIVRMDGTSDLEIESELRVKSGGNIILESGSSITAEASSGIDIDPGALLQVDGSLALNGTGSVNGVLDVASGGQIEVLSGGKLEVQSGGVLELQGSTLTPTYDSPRTFTRPCRPTASFDPAHTTPPCLQALGAGPATTGFTCDNSGASAANLGFDPDVPDAGTITSYEIFITPAGGHGALPANKPRVELWEASGATWTKLSGATDSSGSVAAYEARHSISVTSVSHTLARSTKSYQIIVSVESGANSVTGGAYEIPGTTFTRAKLGEE